MDFEHRLLLNPLGINGFYCHFISAAKDTGGHVFDFQLEAGVIELCYFSKINLELPTNKEYLEKELIISELQEEIEQAENRKYKKISL